MNNVKMEVSDGIAVVAVDRPKALNALNYETLHDLQEVVNDLRVRKDVQVVIVTGGGEKAFVAGADIAEMSTKTPAEAKAFGLYGNSVFAALEKLPQATIAAVNGYALGGGCELSMSCDIRIASEKAKFGQPECGLGIIPGFGGTQRLARLVGMGRAKELIFTCDTIDAQEAYRIGLVNKVVPADELMDTCMAMAKKIQSKGSFAITQAKDAINTGMNTDLDSGISYEAAAFGMSFSSPDQKEGMGAFLEKRKPNLTDF